MDIYIIIKQRFFRDRTSCMHYQVADDNPVVSVYQSLAEAERVCKRLVEAAQQSHPTYKLKVDKPSSEFVRKYGLYDTDTFPASTCMISYNIVHDYALI